MENVLFVLLCLYILINIIVYVNYPMEIVKEQRHKIVYLEDVIKDLRLLWKLLLTPARLLTYFLDGNFLKNVEFLKKVRFIFFKK